MKLYFWKWFTTTWESLLGKAVVQLTKADGKEGLSWEDVRITAQWMREAEINIGTGPERREWVLEQIQKARKVVLPHLVELLFWVALNFAKQKGYVNLSGSGSLD